MQKSMKCKREKYEIVPNNKHFLSKKCWIQKKKKNKITEQMQK